MLQKHKAYQTKQAFLIITEKQLIQQIVKSLVILETVLYGYPFRFHKIHHLMVGILPDARRHKSNKQGEGVT